MRPQIRAKFNVVEVSDLKQRVALNPQAKQGDEDFGKWEVRKVSEKVLMTAVYESGAPTAENVRFAKSTPAGQITMTVDNDQAWGIFTPGQMFYVDFSIAPENCRVCFGQGRKYVQERNDKGLYVSTFTDCDRCKGTGIDPEQPE